MQTLPQFVDVVCMREVDSSLDSAPDLSYYSPLVDVGRPTVQWPNIRGNRGNETVSRVLGELSRCKTKNVSDMSSIIGSSCYGRREAAVDIH